MKGINTLNSSSTVLNPLVTIIPLSTGTVKGAKSFDLTFASDNNINGPGFFTTYNVYDGANSDATHLEGIIGQGRNYLLSFISYPLPRILS